MEFDSVPVTGNQRDAFAAPVDDHVCTSPAHAAAELDGVGWAILHSAQVGYFVVREDGTICISTAKADRFVCDNDGIANHLGKLCGAADRVTHKLRQGIARAAASERANLPSVSMVIPRPSGANGYLASFRRLERRDDRLVLVQVTDPSDKLAVCEAQLRELFGLSKAEVRVANELLSGRTPKQAAAVLGLSVATVRSHLGCIFRKTETKRQPDLVRLLLHAAGHRS